MSRLHTVRIGWMIPAAVLRLGLALVGAATALWLTDVQLWKVLLVVAAGVCSAKGKAIGAVTQPAAPGGAFTARLCPRSTALPHSRKLSACLPVRWKGVTSVLSEGAQVRCRCHPLCARCTKPWASG